MVTTNTGEDVKHNGGVVRGWPRVPDFQLTSHNRMHAQDALKVLNVQISLIIIYLTFNYVNFQMEVLCTFLLVQVDQCCFTYYYYKAIIVVTINNLTLSIASLILKDNQVLILSMLLSYFIGEVWMNLLGGHCNSFFDIGGG